MAFRDMQFEIDAGKRDTASQEVGHMIERINAMVTGAKPSGRREPD
jgi:5-carboxymethyl-2-hydroxymuconate isomerase